MLAWLAEHALSPRARAGDARGFVAAGDVDAAEIGRADYEIVRATDIGDAPRRRRVPDDLAGRRGRSDRPARWRGRAAGRDRDPARRRPPGADRGPGRGGGGGSRAHPVSAGGRGDGARSNLKRPVSIRLPARVHFLRGGNVGGGSTNRIAHHLSDRLTRRERELQLPAASPTWTGAGGAGGQAVAGGGGRGRRPGRRGRWPSGRGRREAGVGGQAGAPIQGGGTWWRPWRRWRRWSVCRRPRRCPTAASWPDRRIAPYTGSPAAPTAFATLRPSVQVARGAGAPAERSPIASRPMIRASRARSIACAFPSPEIDAAGLSDTPHARDQHEDSDSATRRRRYAWRVRACDGAQRCGDWSAVRYLQVGRVREDINGNGYGKTAGDRHRRLCTLGSRRTSGAAIQRSVDERAS